MQWIDSHCHIDTDSFSADRAEVLANARAAGISDLIVVAAGGTIADARKTVDFTRGNPNLHPSVGVHPHEAGSLTQEQWPAFCELACDSKVVAVGESGLDYYYDNAPKDRQAEAFRWHAALAEKLDKPLICHIRDAHDDALALLTAFNLTNVVIHCFTGSPHDAKRYAERGYFISFSGIVTFKGKNAAPIRESVAVVPKDQLLLETDAPFLAPEPHRGKRNEPAFLLDTAAIVAQAAGMDIEDLAKITRANTQRVFSLTSS